jgi:DNA processing protein
MRLIDILTLQRIKGIGNKSLIALIQFCCANKIDSLVALESLDLSKALKLKRASTALNNFFSEGLLKTMLSESESTLKEWDSLGIKVIPFGNANYPKQLTALNDPPAVLFCRGNLDLLGATRSIAVVGTRENTRLGEVIARRTVEYFSKKGFCIVSGLALGIDAIAHRSALDNKGATVAVLVDILSVSPSQNRTLAGQIIDEDGLLIAENPPNTKVIPALFAKRDRIQAGLAMALFAIETSVGGGTMHAVKAANSMNRPVYVPDVVAAKYLDLDEPAISGTQKLVDEGRAIAYSRDSYELITREIDELAKSYCSGINGSGSIL